MRASIAYRIGRDTDGDHMVIEGSRDSVTDVLQALIEGRRAAMAWATDARTGALIAGFYASGAPFSVLPPMLNSFCRGNHTIRPVHARIVDPDPTHGYAAIRGFSSTVLVYSSDDFCIGFADPVDLGYADAAAMVGAGICRR